MSAPPDEHQPLLPPERAPPAVDSHQPLRPAPTSGNNLRPAPSAPPESQTHAQHRLAQTQSMASIHSRMRSEPEHIEFDADGSPVKLNLDSSRIAWINQRPYFVHQVRELLPAMVATDTDYMTLTTWHI